MQKRQVPMAIFISIVSSYALAHTLPTLPTDAYGFVQHPYYSITVEQITYEVDQQGHSPLSTPLTSKPSSKQDNAQYYMLNEHSVYLSESEPIQPYAQVQKTQDQSPYDNELSLGYNTSHQALSLLFIQPCDLYLIGNRVYQSCASK